MREGELSSGNRPGVGVRIGQAELDVDAIGPRRDDVPGKEPMLVQVTVAAPFREIERLQWALGGTPVPPVRLMSAFETVRFQCPTSCAGTLLV